MVDEVQPWAPQQQGVLVALEEEQERVVPFEEVVGAPRLGLAISL